MKRALILSGLAGLAIGLASQLPLSWLGGGPLGGLDPDARALGTVWRGHAAFVPGLPTITTRLEGTGVQFDGYGPEMTLSGKAFPGRLEDTSLSVPVPSLSRFDARLQQMGGTVDLAIGHLAWDSGGCTAAQGTARTTLLSVGFPQYNWSGPTLAGPLSCADGSLRIDMEGDDGTTSATVSVTVSPDGTTASEMTITTPDPGAEFVLAPLGFRSAGPERYALAETGRWR